MTQQTNRLFEIVTIIPRNCTKIDTTNLIKSATFIFDTTNGILVCWHRIRTIFINHPDLAMCNFLSKNQKCKKPDFDWIRIIFCDSNFHKKMHLSFIRTFFKPRKYSQCIVVILIILRPNYMHLTDSSYLKNFPSMNRKL